MLWHGCWCQTGWLNISKTEATVGTGSLILDIWSLEKTSGLFPAFRCTLLVNLHPTVASDSCPWLTWVDPDMVFCCCSLKVPACCTFWDAFVLTMAVKSGFLSYCNLHVSLSDLLWSLIMTFQPTELSLTGLFLSFTPFCCARPVWLKIPEQQFLKYTNNHATELLRLYSPPQSTLKLLICICIIVFIVVLQHVWMNCMIDQGYRCS